MFFNSNVDENGDFDREYLAEEFAEYFASFIGNGIFPKPSTNLQIMAATGMNILVSAGSAWINGYYYRNTDGMIKTLAPADGILNRYDAVVARWSSSDRLIRTEIKQGTPAISPQKPTPQRDADAWELILGYIPVTRGSISITQASIEDTRPRSDLCGYVHGVVDQIDTTTLGLQLQAFIDEYQVKMNERYDEYRISIADIIIQAGEDYGEYADKLVTLHEEFRGYAVNIYDQFVTLVEDYKGRTADKYNEFTAEADSYFALYHNHVQLQYTMFADRLTAILADSEATYQDLSARMNAFIALKTEEFDVWFEAVKGVFGSEDVAGSLLLMIQELREQQPTTEVGTITHGLGRYPQCCLYRVSGGYGTGGYGQSGYGSGGLTTVPAEYALSGVTDLTVRTIPEFTGYTNVAKISDNEYSFFSGSPDAPGSLLLILY
jgi:hypothetical protein